MFLHNRHTNSVLLNNQTNFYFFFFSNSFTSLVVTVSFKLHHVFPPKTAFKIFFLARIALLPLREAAHGISVTYIELGEHHVCI